MGMPAKLARLSHPAIDWETLTRNKNGKEFVNVKCPLCPTPRRIAVGLIAGRLQRGTFSGFCYAHKARLYLKDVATRPEHPAVHWDDTVYRKQGRRMKATHVAVICPQCSGKRYFVPGELEKWIRRGGFSGLCRKCRPHAQKTSWAELTPGRKVDPRKGYIRIAKYAVPEEHRHLWMALVRQRKNAGSRSAFVFEHRLVMSITLGRPLTSNELVDHMDGNKINNHPSNLRLYRRGKNEPGDTSGYGTYYHEWQLALTEIARLKEEIAATKKLLLRLP